MHLIRFGLLAGLIGAPAAAQSPMTAEEFEAFVTGKTLDFSNSAGVFGTEEYLPGRRVRWAFTDDICKFGYWYEADAMICFAYDGYPDQHCWTVWVEGGHLAARPAGDSPDTAPHSITEATKPLTCLGPDVGV